MNVSFGDVLNQGRLGIYISNITEPVGTLFLRLLLMTVLPLVFGMAQRKASRASASLHPKHDANESARNEQMRENE